MKFNILIIAIGAFLSPFSKLLAQPTDNHSDDHQHRHGLHVSVAPEDVSQAISKERLGRLMDEGHEALESGEKHEAHDHHHEHCANCGGHHHHHHDAEEKHGHTHGFSMKTLLSKEAWLEKLNFKQKLLNALRWYQINATDQEIKVHVANIITMLVASHYSEGVIGVNIAQLGLTVDNLFVNAAGVILGTTIIIPGLDPLCIALVWTYKKIPHLMGKMMYVPRVVILTGASVLYRALGLKALMNHVFYKQDALERLEALLAKREGSTELLHVDDDVDFSVKYEGREILSLRGRIEGQRIAWDQMLLSQDLKDPKALAHLKKELAPLSWILRQSVYDVVNRMESPKSVARLSYIDTASESNGMLDVRLKTRGMASVPSTRFIGAKNCLFKLFMMAP